MRGNFLAELSWKNRNQDQQGFLYHFRATAFTYDECEGHYITGEIKNVFDEVISLHLGRKSPQSVASRP